MPLAHAEKSSPAAPKLQERTAMAVGRQLACNPCEPKRGGGVVPTSPRQKSSPTAPKLQERIAMTVGRQPSLEVIHVNHAANPRIYQDRSSTLEHALEALAE